MIRAVRINVPLVDVLAGMPNYGRFLKELISNKHKIKQISAAFLSNESSAILQNKVPPKLGDPGSFLIPCNFKTLSCNALADLGASINLMMYSLYAKLSLETINPTKMSVRLADRSFQYPVGIVDNMLVEVGKFTFPADFVILEMEKDSKVPFILGRPFLHTADANINYLILDIDVINEILEEVFDALLDEGSKILHSIEGTILEEEIFFEFDKFIAMRMPFGLCNASATFQRCMLAIVHDMIEESVERCKDALLVLNLEKYHFMVKEGIVLGHKEFDIEIKDKKGAENVDADHLSRIDNNETSDDSEVDDNFLGETLMEINTRDEPWFADFANYLAILAKERTRSVTGPKRSRVDSKAGYKWAEKRFEVSGDGEVNEGVRS
nr:reverse transcriptase domain-containing protein [Tanacetum cinerariifolium]